MSNNPNLLSKNCICTQTRKGSDILNCLDRGEISAILKSSFKDLKRKFGTRIRLRTKPSAIYNCHGMTFASRRCFIGEPQEVSKILNEDDYIEIKNIAHVLPGDVIIYYATDGDLQHSGTVIQEPKTPFYIPLIISKWGSYSEVIHYSNICPYDMDNIKFYRILQ